MVFLQFLPESTIDGIEVKAEAFAAKSSTIFSDNFGTGGTVSDVPNWDEANGSGNGNNTEARAAGSGDDSASPDGDRFALVDGNGGWICRALNTSGYTLSQLSYYWRGDADAEDNENGVVEYKTSGNCNDGSGWTNLANHELDNGNTGITTWSTLQSVSVPSATTLNIRYRNNSNADNESFRIDGVSVTGTPSAPTSELQVRISGNGSPAFTSYKTQTLTTTETVYTLGGAVDLWGAAWTPSSFTDTNFRLEVRLNNPSSGETASLDHVEVKVYYTEPTPPVANPELGATCGLDIALLADVSTSIDSTEMSQLKSALTTFANAFTGTPTVFSLSKFGTTGSVVSGFSMTPAETVTAISGITTSGGTQYTNWDDGLAKAYGTFDPRTAKPNLLVIATDGNPNRIGTGGTTATTEAAVATAVIRANAIKVAGTRILGIGIGTDVNVPNIEAITGTNTAPPNPISASSDVVTADFSTLATVMSDIAKGLCGGKILVQKQFDTNNDGVAEVDGSVADPLLSGYTFDVSGSPSDPAPQTTDNTGSLQFDNVLNGTYSVIETNLPQNTALKSISCVNGSLSVGDVDLSSKTVSNLTMDTDDTILCTFLNTSTVGKLTVTKIVDNGDSGNNYGPADFPLFINDNPVNSGVPNTLIPDTYTVSETIKDNYIPSFSGACDEDGIVDLHVGDNLTCTITNTYNPPPPPPPAHLTVIKHVIIDNGGTASASDFTMQVNGINVFDTSFPGDETGTTVTLDAGDFSVTETGPTGYAAYF